jgi:hypothetical protein
MHDDRYGLPALAFNPVAAALAWHRLRTRPPVSAATPSPPQPTEPLWGRCHDTPRVNLRRQFCLSGFCELYRVAVLVGIVGRSVAYSTKLYERLRAPIAFAP